MQSFRQYRQIGASARKQYESNKASLKHDPEALVRNSQEANEKDVEHAIPSTLQLQNQAEEPQASNLVAIEGSQAQVATDNDSSSNSSDDARLQETHSAGVDLGRTMTGVEVRRRTTSEGDKAQRVFIVDFQGTNDPLNPHCWSYTKRIGAVINVAMVGWTVGFASSIDSGALKEAAAEFGVSEVVESLATALFLVAFGCGGLVTGPFSEEFGRNPVYIVTMSGFMIFIMASALAPNIGAQFVFRFIAGFFAATPLTCAGGSVSDLFNSLERVYAFPLFAVAAFVGPLCGPIVGGFIAQSYLSWRWTEWVTLILAGCVLASLVLTQPETYGPVLLRWKAQHLRKLTKDDRYVAQNEILAETFLQRVRRALYRPFLILFHEPIVIFWSLYISIIYIVLFTFLNGYTFIFADTYGLGQGLTGLAFVGLIVGIVLSLVLVPLLGKWFQQALRKAQDERGHNAQLSPEIRLWYSMLGAWSVPVGLFWMGWTARAEVSMWSALSASILVGFGILTIFISCYQYLIDSYALFAASALASVTVTRYIVSGGMVVAAIPMYQKLGVNWTCTLLGCLSAIMVPVPFILYRYGNKIRSYSRFAATAKEKIGT